MSDETIRDALDRALDAYEVLAELGEGIEDEWSYVNDLTDTWRTRFDEVAARHGDDDASDEASAAIDRAIDEIRRIEDPHRAIDWLSTFPQVVLVAVGAQAVRFQDAARDARAVVYAGIQADPEVARTATLLADATPVQRLLARAVMNGETVDPAGWRTMFPTLFGPAATGDAAEPARAPRRSWRRRWRSPTAASRSAARSAARSSRRSPPSSSRGGSAPAAVHRERRILFDGVPAEIHPYDVTVERDGAAEAYDCKWGARGINADVLHQLDDARTHAAEEDERLAVALVVFDARRSCDVRLGRQTAPHEGTELVSLETLDGLAARAPVTPT